jgi:L-fuconolactonase
VLIVDAQAHIWRTVRRGAVPHRERPFGVDDLLNAMDGAGVDAAILVPPLWEAHGNGPAVSAATEHSDRLAVMARPWSRVPPAKFAPPAPPVRGYRLVAALEPFRAQVVRGDADRFWRAAERHETPVMVFAVGLLPLIDRVAARHPDLPLIIDNFGLPRDARSSDVRGHIEALIRLARRPNVAVKASALPCYSLRPYPFEDLHEIFARVVDAFGHTRVFWGSDLTRLPCSYREALDMIRLALDLTPTERRWILGQGLLRWLKWRL